jgi:phenylpropionate dioxygenase-like ring-hydroxylating dioxygenase large terminal subunit
MSLAVPDRVLEAADWRDASGPLAIRASFGLPHLTMFSNWPHTLIDPVAFCREQTQLSHVWTFLGMSTDVARDGDWFRATLGTRSVFVQRFGTKVAGFENRCAHRSFPLRNADKGNGPIVCGFHHWRYDQDGRAIGIPNCSELFGVTPRQLDARLSPVEIATCGSLVFGRVAATGDTETLEEYLAESFPILAAMSNSPVEPQHFVRTVKANWRLCYHASVEDYHIVAVHPNTFGKVGYLKRENIGYFRFGRHNAFFTNPDPNALTRMAAECRTGTWQSGNYRVFHIFPNLVVAHFRADGQYWYILVLQYAPVAMNRSTMRAWIYPAPFAADHGWLARWTRPFTHPVRAIAVRYSVNRLLKEDNDVCEKHQSIAQQIQGAPLLGALEERIAWFEEAYAQATRVESVT